MGGLNLRLPKLRQGSDFLGFLEPRRTSEKALVAVIQGEADQPSIRWTHGPATGSAVSRPARSMSWCKRGAERDLQEHRVEALQG
jgi:hypothetical protein